MENLLKPSVKTKVGVLNVYPKKFLKGKMSHEAGNWQKVARFFFQHPIPATFFPATICSFKEASEAEFLETTCDSKLYGI